MAGERIDINKIVKEQVELIKTEEVIKKILEKINSQINQLCVSVSSLVCTSQNLNKNHFQVEELQLKSQEAENFTEEVVIDIYGNEQPVQSVDEINRQPLNLNIGSQSMRSIDDMGETDDDTQM